MPKYLVLYRSPTSAKEMMANATPEQMRVGMEDWNRWSALAGDSVVDLGSPLGDVAAIGDTSAFGDLHTTGFSILQGDSPEAITKLLQAHPHLKTPGAASIVAIECLSMGG